MKSHERPSTRLLPSAGQKAVDAGCPLAQSPERLLGRIQFKCCLKGYMQSKALFAPIVFLCMAAACGAEDTQTETATRALTSASPSAAAAASSINGCLASWRETPCGAVCTAETQADRAMCQQFLDCYRDNACSPTTCGEPDQACGVNQFSGGTAPELIADQVYTCMGCPPVVIPQPQPCVG
jgi:hypothetical protein